MAINPREDRTGTGINWSRFAHPGAPDFARLPFVRCGEYLVEGDVYIDLSDPARGPFKAMQWQCAGSQNRYVAASRLPASWWDLLVRMTAYTSLAGATLWPVPVLTDRR